MDSTDVLKKGICILSFDSGGPGTYSQLLILKEYTSRLAADLGIPEHEVCPADYFDLIGGVGFGGLVAVMLGLLRMNVDSVIDEVVAIASVVFRKSSEGIIDQDENSCRLKQAIEGMVQAGGALLNTKMYEPNRPQTRCKVALYAATSARMNYPQIFRSYPSRGSILNATVVEAVCATMSIPSHFLPVEIGPRLREQSFIGGALGTNNPTRELIKEASNIFGKHKRVAQILSIGSGRSPVPSLKSPTDEAEFNCLLRELATDCEIVAEDLHTRLQSMQVYFRLNVDRGMEKADMGNWKELGRIESHTAAYIATAVVSASLDTSLRHLRERIGTVTLGQLSEWR